MEHQLESHFRLNSLLKNRPIALYAIHDVKNSHLSSFCLSFSISLIAIHTTSPMLTTIIFPLFTAARRLITDTDAKIISEYGEVVLKDKDKMEKINVAVEESKKKGRGEEKSIIVEFS